MLLWDESKEVEIPHTYNDAVKVCTKAEALIKAFSLHSDLANKAASNAHSDGNMKEYEQLVKIIDRDRDIMKQLKEEREELASKFGINLSAIISM